MLEIFNVTTFKWEDAQDNFDVTLTDSSKVIVYRGAESRTTAVIETVNFPGNHSSFTRVVNETIVPPGASVVSGYSYILQLNVTYKLENLGMHDKSVLKNKGT